MQVHPLRQQPGLEMRSEELKCKQASHVSRQSRAMSLQVGIGRAFKPHDPDTAKASRNPSGPGLGIPGVALHGFTAPGSGRAIHRGKKLAVHRGTSRPGHFTFKCIPGYWKPAWGGHLPFESTRCRAWAKGDSGFFAFVTCLLKVRAASCASQHWKAVPGTESRKQEVSFVNVIVSFLGALARDETAEVRRRFVEICWCRVKLSHLRRAEAADGANG